MGYIVGPGAAERLPGNIKQVYPAMMARMDSGMDRLLSSIEGKFPGKEIWVTEWNMNGTRFFFNNTKPGVRGMVVHLTARMLLSLLRHESVTISSFHMLSYKGGAYGVIAPDPKWGFRLNGQGKILKWFNLAAGGGAKYQGVHVDGSRPIPGKGTVEAETYRDVEAALFLNTDNKVLIIQNAAGEAKNIDLSFLAQGKSPNSVETMETPDLAKNYAFSSPDTKTIKPGSIIRVPTYSITRATWQ